MPIYGEDGTTLTGYDVRVVSKENLALTSTDGAYNATLHRWGLTKTSTYDCPNFGSIKTDIESAADVADAFDIYELGNITTADGINQNVTISDDTYIDDTQADGYKVFTSGALTDFNGNSNTEKIVNHAKKIVSGYLGKSWPTTMTELADAMQALIAENQSASQPFGYDAFYYPAAWGCTLYEPSASGKVADCFKSGQWYLPAMGEVGRIRNFYRQGTTADEANFATDSEARTPIIANSTSRAGKVVMELWSDSNRYDTEATGDRGAPLSYQTSTESSTDYCWLYAARDYDYTCGSPRLWCNMSKMMRYTTRPCCSVTFNLNE